MDRVSTTGSDKEKISLSIGPCIGLAIIAVNLVIAAFGGVIAPYSESSVISDIAYAPPNDDLMLGADFLGRDVLSRLLYGARNTIGISLLATVIGFFVGLAFGFTAAALGGWVDAVISRLNDVVISIPPLLFALIAIAGLGTSLPLLVGVIALLHASRVMRISRSIAVTIAALEFVEAAHSRGEGFVKIIILDIWPNALRPLAAEFGLRMTFSILFISSLSFLGLGLSPPTADWGVMVRENLGGVFYGSAAVVMPALAIGLLAVGINLVVDWLSGGDQLVLR